MLFLYLPFVWVGGEALSEQDGSGFSLNTLLYVCCRSLYWEPALRTFLLSLVSAIIAVSIVYPAALYLARRARHGRMLLFFLTLSFGINYLVRILSWKTLLNPTLFVAWPSVNRIAAQLLYSDAAVMLGLVYASLPLSLVTLYGTIDGIDKRLDEAAIQLGASRPQVFRKIILPLSRPGIILALSFSFLLGWGSYLEAEMLGGADSVMLGTLVRNQFAYNLDWSVACALSLVMLMISFLVLFVTIHSVGQGGLLRALSRNNS